MSRKILVDNNKLLAQVEEMVSNGKKVTILAKGYSMTPFIIGERDSVELTKIDNDIKIGDIVLAKIATNSKYVLHRVIKIQQGTLTLMGDGNIFGTEQCLSSAVIARVTLIKKPHKNVNPLAFKEQCLAWIWRKLQPFRRYLLAILARLRKK